MRCFPYALAAIEIEKLLALPKHERRAGNCICYREYFFRNTDLAVGQSLRQNAFTFKEEK